MSSLFLDQLASLQINHNKVIITDVGKLTRSLSSRYFTITTLPEIPLANQLAA
jgi:hypothetical protein